MSGTVRIWDTVNEEHSCKLEIKPIAGQIFDIAWSPDSKRVVVVGDGREKYGAAFFMVSEFLEYLRMIAWTRIVVRPLVRSQDIVKPLLLLTLNKPGHSALSLAPMTFKSIGLRVHHSNTSFITNTMRDSLTVSDLLPMENSSCLLDRINK